MRAKVDYMTRLLEDTFQTKMVSHRAGRWAFDERYARLLVILLASVASALTVPLVGVIGWVGLIVPHLARFLVGPDHRRQLPASILLGGIFLLLADDLARSLFPVQIPLGVATDLLGIATFLLVLRRLRKSLAD